MSSLPVAIAVVCIGNNILKVFVFQKKQTFTSIPGDPAPGPNTTTPLLSPPGNNPQTLPNQLEQEKTAGVEADSRSSNPFSLTVFPNPALGVTKISFTVSNAQHIRIEILGFSGRCIAVPIDGDFIAGEYTYSWDPGALPSGIYLCRLTGDGTAAVRIVLQ